MTTAWHWKSIAELLTALDAGEVTSVALTEHYLSRIETHNAALNAYLFVDREGALRAAREADEARAHGARGALLGVPVAVKDNLCTSGVPTTCASRMLEAYVPPYDAHVVSRLREAGAVILGKLNMDEFAMGSSNENSAFGAVKNPYDTARVPGGSSGGSAAAVAAGLCAAALGSDTGGSVRQPAAFCGITAIKPTYGRVSRYGLVAFASSLDQVGPMARTAEDTARLFDVVSGHDGRDATSLPLPPAATATHEEALKGLRVGVLRDLQGEGDEGAGHDPAVHEAMARTLEFLRAQGAEVVDVRLPAAQHAVSTYYLIAPSEASSNLARFDGVRYGLRVDGATLNETYEQTRAKGFGKEVKRRIMLGTYALSAGYYDAYYLKAQKVRTMLCDDYARAFESCDVILSPTAPTPAFALGEKVSSPLSMYLADIYTLPPSLAGLPAVSTPVARTAEGLPIGVQLTGAAHSEARLLGLARALEAMKDAGFTPPTAFA